MKSTLKIIDLHLKVAKQSDNTYIYEALKQIKEALITETRLIIINNIVNINN